MYEEKVKKNFSKLQFIYDRHMLFVLHVDPKGCTHEEFSCLTREGERCLPNAYKCDHVQDCEDNEDEADCPDLDTGRIF